MTTARQRVLNYLKKQRSASAAQIGHGLNMSAATVRYHLSIMQADERIALVDQKRSGNRGRPVKLYGLSERTLGNNFALLSEAVLDELLKKLSPAKKNEVINAIAGHLALQFDVNNLDLPMAKRLAIIVEELNEYHYQARWEAGAEGPRILFGHCPYAAIIGNHPELCQMDESLLGELMGRKISQVAKIGGEPAGSLHCIFRAG